MFGILGYYEGVKAEPELPMGVYRIDPHSGEVELMLDEVAGDCTHGESGDEAHNRRV